MYKNFTLVSHEFVFPEGLYFPSCHASTLALTDGGIVTACFGGTREGAADVAIWVAVSSLRQEAANSQAAHTSISSGGFCEPVRICAAEGVPHWNPVLFRGENGGLSDELLLYFKVGFKIPEWETYFCVSRDGGSSWTAPLPLVPGDNSSGRGPVKNKPVRLSDGAWLAPRSVETSTDWTVEPDISTDLGKSWHKLTPLSYKDKPSPQSKSAQGLIQPTIWQGADGGVHMLMRSTWGRIWRADSADLGRTWSEAYETELPNNNSGIDLDRLDDGALALCMNPEPGRRWPLDIIVSDDDGTTFRKALTLESEEGEFSYPSVLAEGNSLHITYTWKRRNIVYAKITAE